MYRYPPHTRACRPRRMLEHRRALYPTQRGGIDEVAYTVSLSLHSSRALMMTRVETLVEVDKRLASSSAKEVSLSGIGTLLRDSERPFGDADTDRQAERRELGRSPGDCHDPRSLVSRRSRPLAFQHLDERLGPGCSTGKRASPTSQCSSSRISFLIHPVRLYLFPHRCSAFAG